MFICLLILRSALSHKLRTTLTIVGSQATLTLDSGRAGLDPGRWAFTMQGVSSGNVAVAYFCVTP